MKERLYRLLRWSEKYTKTDMLYLTRGGFWLSLGYAIQVASGLVLAIAFANLLPKETYGTYQFIMSGAAILSVFTLTGMNTAVTHAVARGSEGALRAGFHAQLRWSSGIVLAGAGAALYYYLHKNDTLALSFIIAGTFLPLIAGFGLTRYYLIGKHLFRESALLGLGRRLLPLVAVLCTIFLTHDPVAIVFMYFASNTISAGLLYLLIIRRYRLPISEEADMVNYSKHLSFLRMFTGIISQADDILIWSFLGAAPLAAYVLAQLPMTQIQNLSNLFYSLTLPKLTVTPFADLQKTLPRKIRILFFAVAGGVGIYILVAPLFFKILFPAYPESIVISQVLALGLLAIPRALYGQALTAHRMKKKLYVMNIGQSLVRLILLLILLPIYGIWGAVYAVLASQAYLIILTPYLFSKMHTPKDKTGVEITQYEENY